MRLNNIFKSALGSQAQEYRLSIISNNLANLNTPGFKKDVPVFRGFLLNSTKPDFSQGQLRQTGSKFDLALSGPGFFQIETPGGTRYTRNGALTINHDGELVTKSGFLVSGNISIPESAVEVHISPEGRVFADGQEVGAIDLVEFDNLGILEKQGDSLFSLRGDEPGHAAENTTVEQGYLEVSNVNAVASMINLIDTTRTYEAIQKTIHSFEEADSKTINEVGRLY